ncbi:MAG TPA: iron-sulfur cluster repair di-iron protein [Cerasibacillus sp.]|uniref:iron-sulfur cluster repair di-iron protein n=1 Tax=Cerasibacillus sp. TaxID=2498711 RepID=UPI002F427635
MTFTAEHTPADIVKTFPQASDLFKKHRIDFCCGGGKPLKETFNERHLDEEAILSELNHAFTEWNKQDHDIIDWEQVPLSKLVNHIIDTHHAYLKQELPALGEFVTKIFRVHGTNNPHLRELHRVYNEFKVEMEEHSIKEENEVFPLIKKYEEEPSEQLLQQIRDANGELEGEHDVTGDFLKKMRDITNGFEPPMEACGSYRMTYARLAELEDMTFQHIHLENNILFKRL